MNTLDHQIRLKAFKWLEEQVAIHGPVLPRILLQRGFVFNDERIPLISPQGIFKPKNMDIPLSITTSPKGPYEDIVEEDDIIYYKYRGRDPFHRDNVGLRMSMEQNIPLIYFHGLIPGQYSAVWPVYIVEDSPETLTFTVMVDDIKTIACSEHGYLVAEEKRAYITAEVKRRLFQQTFRERVLEAYHTKCAICRLKHRELLEASHIIPDSEPESKPIVSNGISLCTLHHTAFDKYFIGITPDYIVEVRKDIMDEEDGPTLKYSLQGLHKSKIHIPRKKDNKPDKEFLDWRYQKFQGAG